jgi:dihydrofolate reductase
MSSAGKAPSPTRCWSGGRPSRTSAATGVDEFRLYTYPVVQGRGRRLFPDGYPETHLRLTDSRSFRAGVTYSRYRAN